MEKDQTNVTEPAVIIGSQPEAGNIESNGVSNVTGVTEHPPNTNETNLQNEVPPDTNVPKDSHPNTGRPQRNIKLTAKAYAAKLEKLQQDRKSKLKQVSTLQTKITELMKNGETEKEVLFEYQICSALYNQAHEVHTSILPLLPPDERERQDFRV